jgi:hypothetical protein
MAPAKDFADEFAQQVKKIGEKSAQAAAASSSMAAQAAVPDVAAQAAGPSAAAAADQHRRRYCGQGAKSTAAWGIMGGLSGSPGSAITNRKDIKVDCSGT